MVQKTIEEVDKYNIQPKDLERVEILVTPSPEMGFWRNNVINAWCMGQSFGTKDDFKYVSESDWWIGIYDKPYRTKLFHYNMNCMGGMCSLKFSKFNDKQEFEHNEKELLISFIETINNLIDNHIIKVGEKENE